MKTINGFHKRIGLLCCKIAFKQAHAKLQTFSCSAPTGCQPVLAKTWQDSLVLNELPEKLSAAPVPTANIACDLRELIYSI